MAKRDVGRGGCGWSGWQPTTVRDEGVEEDEGTVMMVRLLLIMRINSCECNVAASFDARRVA